MLTVSVTSLGKPSVPRPERLSTTDLAVLWPEDLGWPQDVGLLVMLDGRTLFDDEGRFCLEHVRGHVADRIGLLPSRFRKLLVRPRAGLGRPYWVDAAPVEVSAHVQAVELPPAAGERELLETCEQLRQRRFDVERPRWMLWLLTGLPDQHVGLFLNVHHCLVDGVAGVAAFGAFVDLDVPIGATATDESPGRRPTVVELLVDAVRARFEGLAAALVALRHPRALWDRVVEDARAWRRVAAEKVPATSLNKRVGSGRRHAVVRSQLQLFKNVGHAHGATVNDVLLCVLSGGFRELLVSRGEPVDGLVLRAAVPVSLHPHGPGRAEGNSDAGMLLALPIGQADPIARLRQIAEDSAERKRTGIVPGATSGMFSSPLLQRILIRLTPRQRMSNTYVANVPGPPIPLQMAGADILELFPIVPILGNLTIGVGALSYNGQFNLTVVTDTDSGADLDVFVAGLREAIDELAVTQSRSRPANVS